jgi:peptidoglycan/xylan/chitin deacetylase (PgdA/CDA1 family)
VRGVDTGGDPAVAFTFDDGPDPVISRQIMDVMAAHGATATFFLIGNSLGANVDVAREEVARGFAVGNHSLTHHVDVTMIADEVPKMNTMIHRLLGVDTPYFRAPGLTDARPIDAAFSASGQCEIATDVDIGDWHRVARPAADLCATFAATLHPGEIVLLHDGMYHAPTVAALPCMFDVLTARGYRVLSLEDLLADGTPYHGYAVPTGV